MVDPRVVHGLLERIRDAPEGQGLPTLKELFSYLGYEYLNAPLRPDEWPNRAKQALAPGQEPRTLFRSGEFQIAYVPLRALRISVEERPVMSHLLRQTPYLLAVFSDPEGRHWHFVNAKWDDEPKRRRLFRRISVGPGDRLRTASERLSLIEAPEGIPLLDLKDLHDKAFDVQEVTDIFYRAYEQVFRGLQYDLEEQTNDATWAHDFALQFLNRLMFLYFVQRKRWLGEDPEFLGCFWKEYRASRRPKDTFVKEWLYVLFFRAFNNRFSPVEYFSEDTNEILQLAPYLNGGLFLPKPELDDKYSFAISDEMFKEVFSFLEGHNFTIREDNPLDQEVAVDPEMLGRVYESLVNVSEEADERGEAGIFYTPRTEIDLMCRLALVDYLTNHLGKSRKSLLYESVFSFEPQDKQRADLALERENLWPDLDRLLRGVKVVDPACGSGSFLVGMLYVLSDLRKRANKVLGTYHTDYELKKEIIGENLYGVDVMRWAVDVAELRLWLQLVVESDLSQPERIVRPLLPYLSFKIREGDSLVQEVGGINLGLRRLLDGIPAPLKGKLTRLQGKKLQFYDNPRGEDQTPRKKAIEHEELLIFREILDDRAHRLTNKIKGLKQKLETRQADLEGRVVLGLEPGEAKRRKRELEEAKSELGKVEQARRALRTAKDVPFVWDIAFVEVFLGDKKGFDVVIGNPPYVMYKRIADPKEPKDQTSRQSGSEYKTKLRRSVYSAYPRYFGYNASRDTVAKQLNGRSDLYVYFYFHGLSLLNPRGSFCFITSFSWLDVDYGRGLQEFLLKHCHVKLILDNEIRRSFARADVNTIIALFSSPDDSSEWGLDKTARFVMFMVPFEHVLDPVILEEIDEAQQRRICPEYRVTPLLQHELLMEGLEPVKEGEEERPRATGPLISGATYMGGKWSGKYLRAPEIFFSILAKGKDRIVPLGTLATIRTGVKEAGYGDYIVPRERYATTSIPPNSIPIIKRTASHRSIDILVADSLIVKHTRKLAPVCKRRNSPILWLAGRGLTHKCHHNVNGHPFTGNYIGIEPYSSQSVSHEALVAILNSTFVILVSEVLGRHKGIGGGACVITKSDLQRLPVVDLNTLTQDELTSLEGATRELARRELLTVFEEFGSGRASGASPASGCDAFSLARVLPDRRRLDDTIFDIIGLIQGEREAVYEAVINLVEARLKKAQSL